MSFSSEYQKLNGARSRLHSLKPSWDRLGYLNVNIANTVDTAYLLAHPAALLALNFLTDEEFKDEKNHPTKILVRAKAALEMSKEYNKDWDKNLKALRAIIDAVEKIFKEAESGKRKQRSQ
jgi:hypothetical protein